MSTDFAYLAGIIDGEGSIQLTKSKKSMPYPSVDVTSTDKELVDWVKWLIPASCISKQKTYKDTHKPAWIWRCSYNQALVVLGNVYPYLKIERKKQRAFLLLTQYKELTPRNGKYTPEMLARKEEFFKRFRSL